jgi:hypothetical protein
VRTESAICLLIDQDAQYLDPVRQLNQEVPVAGQMMNFVGIAAGEIGHRGDVRPIGDGDELALGLEVFAKQLDPEPIAIYEYMA